jgi:hypothetical protein
VDLPLSFSPATILLGIFISSILILHMVNTRNRVATNNAKNNGESNNQEATPSAYS